MISAGVVMTVYLEQCAQYRLARSIIQSLYLVRISQFDDMRVPQQLQILNLSLNPACHVSCNELSSRDDLQRNLLARDLMDGKLHFTERSLAKRLENLVLAKALLGRFLHLGALGRGLLAA